ncbi:hypothetical protein HDU67_005322 [Dinochytrium kinnereticum]|nr:hypothetical protein HDU67_005322 [Dinochytrium kinnereticum]
MTEQNAVVADDALDIEDLTQAPCLKPCVPMVLNNVWAYQCEEREGWGGKEMVYMWIEQVSTLVR